MSKQIASGTPVPVDLCPAEFLYLADDAVLVAILSAVATAATTLACLQICVHGGKAFEWEIAVTCLLRVHTAPRSIVLVPFGGFSMETCPEFRSQVL